MCSSIPTIIPLPIPQQELKELVSKGKDWAIMHGVSMRTKEQFSEDTITFAPFVLFPSTMPKKDFQHAVELQTIFQELFHKVAYDREFLKMCLENIVQVDEFTAKLFEIYETTEKEGVSQSIGLGLFRCDYMLQCNDKRKDGSDDFYPFCNWKLIEINTIAAGFGWLGPASGLLHRYILQEMNQLDNIKNLPVNNALTGLCGGILEAWELYGNSSAVILILVEDITYNISDQKFHEYTLKEMNPSIRIIRRNLTQIYYNGELNEENELIIDNNIVGVVYFRTGYEPSQYPTENEWSARLLLERSKAIKCPNLQYHLAGTKKVQQELSKPGAIERFINDEKKVKLIRNVFVNIYGLEFDESGEEAVRLALEDPERYILKPQREGGGHNIYGKKIRQYIDKLKNTKERIAWILMEKIFPPIIKGYMIRPGTEHLPPITDMVSELGIFGVIIGDSTRIISNRQVGHMLRTKVESADEGGVAAGLGALDSPYLID
ncbi:glutathione synthetase-like [Diorhabda sublineata]|uniref:glutathione synthetase-like n=1 Tax=Diorhabda sublineata TaxID=1163346 RepID=UPI0024E0858D|nr:glutathione synthetase-like [Diorhabda sublineata]